MSKACNPGESFCCFPFVKGLVIILENGIGFRIYCTYKNSDFCKLVNKRFIVVFDTFLIIWEPLFNDWI